MPHPSFSLKSLLSIALGTTALSVYASAVIEARQESLPAGWKSLGCYLDAVGNAPRSLKFQTMFGGATVESCIAACSGNRYNLAGLEFGRECWCDSYMTWAVPTSDADCNTPCAANATELCGAANRLSVYASTNTPPSFCLGLGSQFKPFTFKLVAFFVPASPGAPVGAPVPLGSIQLPDQLGPPTFVLGPVNSDEAHVYSIGFGTSGILQTASNSLPEALSLQPLPGGNQFFKVTTWNKPAVEFSNYCAQENPLAPSFWVGPPALAVDGQINVWGLCDGAGLVYLPSSGNCAKVILGMVQVVA